MLALQEAFYGTAERFCLYRGAFVLKRPCLFRRLPFYVIRRAVREGKSGERFSANAARPIW